MSPSIPPTQSHSSSPSHATPPLLFAALAPHSFPFLPIHPSASETLSATSASGSGPSSAFCPPISLLQHQHQHQHHHHHHPFLSFPSSLSNDNDSDSSINSLVQISNALANPSEIKDLQLTPHSASLGPLEPSSRFPAISTSNSNPSPSCAPVPPEPAPHRRRRSSSPIMDHVRLGLARLKNLGNLSIYSQTGFDLMGALARVDRRPNPKVNIGPVDCSTAIVIVDARQPDFPIVFATPSFSTLTGYELHEILGQNCRFLQRKPEDPRHSKQRKTDSLSKKIDSPHLYPRNSFNIRPAQNLKKHIIRGEETQSAIINYRKNGHAFTNLLTVVPIPWDSDDIAYFVGFQVDVAQQTDRIYEHAQGAKQAADGQSSLGAIVFPKRPPNLPSHQNLNPWFSSAVNTPTAQEGPTNVQDYHSTSSPGFPDLSDRLPNRSRRVSPESLTIDRKAVLAYSRDLVLAISLKGRLFFVSRSIEEILGYSADDLVHQNISKICHTTDLTMILRQLKEIGNTADTPIELNFRTVRKDGELMWMEFEGKLHLEAGKGRKYVVVLGRPRQIGNLPWNSIPSLSPREFWMRMSRDGLCLFCTKNVMRVLGYTVRMMVGRSLVELSLGADSDLWMSQVVRQVEAGGDVKSLHRSLIHRGGRLIDFELSFYPSHLPRSGRIRELYCRARLVKSQHMAGPDMGADDVDQLKLDSTPRHPSPRQTLEPLNGLLPPKHEVQMCPSNIFSNLDVHQTTAWNLELSELKQKNRALKEEMIKRGFKEVI